MMRYYLAKGHTLNELTSLSTIEKSFMIQCMKLDIEEEKELNEALGKV